MKKIIHKVYTYFECKVKGHRWLTLTSRDHTDMYLYRECQICGKTELLGYHDEK